MPRHVARVASFSMMLAGAFALAGCSAGDVELNGKLFDAMGVSGSAQSQRSKTPQLASRAPLVVPPSLDKLPPPETASVANTDGSFPIDPEQRSSLSATELQRRQVEYCKEHYDKAVAFGDHAKAATAMGPMGSCAPSAMKNVNVNSAFTR